MTPGTWGCSSLVPQNSVFALAGGGVRSRALAHPVDLTDRDVQTEEEL